MGNIRIVCRCDIDQFRHIDWPTAMVCRPNLGDIVRPYDSYNLEMAVLSIMHCQDIKGPYLIVRLGLK
jgi:hypothetical protein